MDTPLVNRSNFDKNTTNQEKNSQLKYTVGFVDSMYLIWLCIYNVILEEDLFKDPYFNSTVT